MADALIHLVFDMGSGVSKTGFSGEEAPKDAFPTIVGKTKVKGIFVGDEKKESFLGKEAEKKFGILDICEPVKEGLIEEWDQMEKMWAHAFFEVMKVAPEEQNVFLTESPFNTREKREKTLEIMFETFNTPGTYLAPQSVLAAYSVGQSTCITIDFGHGSTNFTPIYEGIAFRESVTHIPIAGKAIHELLIDLLRKNGQVIDSKMQEQSINKVKEKYSYFALDYENELKKYDQNKNSDKFNITWELPDKRKININKEIFQAPEALFNPLFFSSQSKSFQASFLECLKKTDLDLREELVDCIIVNGASSLFPGFKERAEKELHKVSEGLGLEPKIHIYPEAQFMAWIGGSILSSLNNFTNLWVTKAEYKENGKGIVHKKCF